MEDPIFDAIFVLCRAAEEEGFVSVADALELVLDVYLLERSQLYPPDPVFRSLRAAQMHELDAWREDLQDEKAAQVFGWSMSNFPLMRAV